MDRRCLFALAGLAVLGAAACAAEATGQDAARRILILTGCDYPGHKWKETAPVLWEAIGADPRMEVRIEEEPEFLASPKLHEYDAVVLHYMNWERPDPGAQARRNLRRFVRSGKGLVLVHFACGAFQGWDEFEKIAGRAWDPKLRPHDPFGTFRVEVADPNHAVMRGMEAFETTDELYTCLAGETPIRVLATARSKVDGNDYPMAFTLRYGKGRVFHSVLGHDVGALKNPPVARMYRRAAAWAARLQPVEPRKGTKDGGRKKDRGKEGSSR